MIAQVSLHLAAVDMDDLVKVVAAIVLFVLPAVKSIFDARRKRNEQRDSQRDSHRDESRGEQAGTSTMETPEQEVAGRDLFEQLLRGEVLEEQQRPPPIPTAPQPTRTWREAPVVLTESKALTESPPLTDTPSFDEAPPLTGARPLTDTPAQWERSLEGASPYESRKLATESLGEFAAPVPFGTGRRELPAQASAADPNAAMTQQSAMEVASTSGKRRRDRLQPGAPSRRELRRAVILSEVLAPPLALRRPGTSPGLPAGLR